MNKLVSHDINKKIDVIERFVGGNQDFEIVYSTPLPNKEYYKITFEIIWDMRYTTENGTIDRFYHYRSNEANKDIAFGSSIYEVEDSDYLNYFENEVSGTIPTENMKHYIFIDNVDTVIDVLTNKEFKIEKIEFPKKYEE